MALFKAGSKKSELPMQDGDLIRASSVDARWDTQRNAYSYDLSVEVPVQYAPGKTENVSVTASIKIPVRSAMAFGPTIIAGITPELAKLKVAFVGTSAPNRLVGDYPSFTAALNELLTEIDAAMVPAPDEPLDPDVVIPSE
jgi:hypothetical protein